MSSITLLLLLITGLEGGGEEEEEGGEVGKRGMVKEEQREHIATNDTEQKVFVTSEKNRNEIPILCP